MPYVCFVKHELKEVLKYMGRKFGPTTQPSPTDRDRQIQLKSKSIENTCNWSHKL